MFRSHGRVIEAKVLAVIIAVSEDNINHNEFDNNTLEMSTSDQALNDF